MSGVNKKLLLVIAFATLVAVIPIPRAHASTFANSPSGSFLGTQTVTDTFTCPSSTQVATDIGPWHDSDTAQTGFGLTTEPPACPSNSGDTMSYYTQAVGSNGRIGGGVISQTFDCGQEDTDGCGSRFSTTYSYSNGQLTSERYTCATAQTSTQFPNACATFYIPNFGQSSTPVDVSTDVFVVGGMEVLTSPNCSLFGCFGNELAASAFTVTLQLTNTATNNVWTMQLVNDAIQCYTSSSSCSAGSFYNQDFAPGSCTHGSWTGTCATTFNLPPGYYNVTLNTEIEAKNSVPAFAEGDAYTCFQYNSNCSAGYTTTSCPAGVPTYNAGDGNGCQYLSWKWVSFTSHLPDFSMTGIPASTTLDAGSSVNIPLSINSVLINGNSAYSLSNKIYVVGDGSDDQNLGLSFNPITTECYTIFGVTFCDGYWQPAPGGSVSTTLTVSDRNTCDSGTHSIQVILGLRDANINSNSQIQRTYNIPITVNPTCDFSICCSSSFSLVTGGEIASTGMNIQSLNGFSGTVSLSLSTTMVGDTSISVSPTSVTLSSGQRASSTLTITTGSQTGTWSFTVTAQSGNLVHTVTYTVTVSQCCTGGGGGSVAAGTLITLADGTQVPVQSLKVGMQLLSYDMATHQYVTTTITRFVTVMTHNQMVISTSTGKPLIVDQNPAQKLYVKLPDGTVTLMSVTDLKIGYNLFDAISQTWVPITSIHYQNGGQHLMYDIYTSSPGNYIANGYLDPLKM